jgi:hypothetical protein
MSCQLLKQGCECTFTGREPDWCIFMGFARRPVRAGQSGTTGNTAISEVGSNGQRHSYRESLPTKRRNCYNWTETSYDGWYVCSQGTITYKHTFSNWDEQIVPFAKGAQTMTNHPHIPIVIVRQQRTEDFVTCATVVRNQATTVTPLITKVLWFIRSVELMVGWRKWGSTTNPEGRSAKKGRILAYAFTSIQHFLSFKDTGIHTLRTLNKNVV